MGQGSAPDFNERLFDNDCTAGRGHVEQRQHVAVAQPNAAVGQGDAHGLVIPGAMQVDVTALGVAIASPIEAGLLPTQPEDPRQYPVPLGVVGGQLGGPDLTGRSATDEHRAQRLAFTDAGAHPVAATGRAATALLLTGTGQCRGYWKAADLLPSGIAGEALVLYGYVDQIQGHAQLRGKTHTIADRRPGGKPRPEASLRRRGLGGVHQLGAHAGSEG